MWRKCVEMVENVANVTFMWYNGHPERHSKLIYYFQNIFFDFKKLFKALFQFEFLLHDFVDFAIYNEKKLKNLFNFFA